jgi:hypothetical protein
MFLGLVVESEQSDAVWLMLGATDHGSDALISETLSELRLVVPMSPV